MVVSVSSINGSSGTFHTVRSNTTTSGVVRALWPSINVSIMTQACELAGTSGRSVNVGAVFVEYNQSVDAYLVDYISL